MKKQTLTLLLLLCVNLTFSQDEKVYNFTLQEAINFATDSAYANINAQKDVAIALKRKWETTADGLPQISGQVNYENNPKLTVTPLPAEIVGGEPGTTVPVTFGQRHNMRATGTVNQLIFDGSYIVALQAAKTFLEYSANAKEKTALEVRKNVITAYGNVLLAKNSIEITQNNLNEALDNLNETRKIYENGLAEEEDVEQLQITSQQLKSQLRNAERMYNIAKESLNMVLGIDVSVEVILEDTLENLAAKEAMLQTETQEFNFENTIDYKIAKNLVEQRDLELKLQRSQALPSLSAFANYGATSFGNQFEFFESGTDWFEFATIGVSLNVPIFSSFKRDAQTQQAKIELEKAKLQRKQTINQIQLDLNSAQSDFDFAVENYTIAQKNLNLAERIQQKNEVKFKEGLASSFELRQAQTQLYQAQNEYLQAMLNLINTKAELEKVKNTPLQSN
ncbi:TolC family protein [Psychroflexus sp. ALD_RP9]|uniref:TolC family protein n=1 Tax=Psychroflexus sp. ALD_RP9 TaxID=2777186 RepID=UPI001A8DA05E|nr:TolC family protein [Psychroflexus sp. ALD_RP9]QSS96277.1 TolC family protein [Psychroflexus sp. ALD_RP9]